MNKQCWLAVVVLVGSWNTMPEVFATEKAGQEVIKSLSAEEQEGLKAGKGLKQSMVAELNGYPGPVHVLELAKELRLSPQQEASAQTLAREMTAQAVPVGEEILRQEAKLDHLFASGHAAPDKITPVVMELGQLRGRLRLIHLNTHIAMQKILTAEQINHYNTARNHGQKHKPETSHTGH
ncbi:MAG: hypothetical protein H7833_18585 [Magnetococcus sp. DMHC-1]